MPSRTRLTHAACAALLSTAALALFPHVALAQPAPDPQPAQPAPVEPTPAQPAPPQPVAATPAPDKPVAAAPAKDALPPEDVPKEKAYRDDSPLADDGHPLAGYHNGLMYLRDPHDNFRLYIQGRAQIDAYTFLGPGVPDSTQKATLFLRRIRPEVTGSILHHIYYMIAGDFGATAIDNPKGTNEISAAAPGAAPSATSGRYSSSEVTKFQAAPTDVFVNVEAHPLLNAQIGQFDAPFTMENRTSDKYLPFMERSMAVRDVGVPTNKEIGLMLWGQHPNFYYSLGIFDGAGQNRLSTDGRGDFMTREYVRPLAGIKGNIANLQNFQIGGSFRYGSRDKTFTAYDYPGLSTQGQFPFWSPTYTGAGGPTHIIPAGDQVAGAVEVRIPISILDITHESVFVANGTREAIEGFENTNSERFGKMLGYSYYVQLGLWAYGKRDIRGLPGDENLPKLDFKKADPTDPPVALEFLAKWEQLRLKYESAARGGTADAKNIDGFIKANAFSLGANFWATKHARFTANYVVTMFPGSEPVKASPTCAGADAMPCAAQNNQQRAIAPGNGLAAGVNDIAREDAHILHEILFRVAIAL